MIRNQKKDELKKCIKCDNMIIQNILDCHERVCSGTKERNDIIECNKCLKTIKIRNLKNHKEICSRNYKCNKCN